MSLSINEEKVAELLKSSKGYEGFTSDVLPTAIENCNPVYPVTSATYTPAVLVTAETRERFMTARRQIEESGVPLKGADELTREIDEMRGRR
jgi:hypothetical protein